MTIRTYRDRTSGKLWQGSPAVARFSPHLEPVGDDAKPLAYVPAAPEQVKNARAKSAAAKAEQVAVDRSNEEDD